MALGPREKNEFLKACRRFPNLRILDKNELIAIGDAIDADFDVNADSAINTQHPGLSVARRANLAKAWKRVQMR
jgi:hypothetical protein